MSNENLIEEIIRLGWRIGPKSVLQMSAMYHLVLSVRNGHAKLTKKGRAALTELRAMLRKDLGESS